MILLGFVRNDMKRPRDNQPRGSPRLLFSLLPYRIVTCRFLRNPRVRTILRNDQRSWLDESEKSILRRQTVEFHFLLTF